MEIAVLPPIGGGGASAWHDGPRYRQPEYRRPVRLTSLGFATYDPLVTTLIAIVIAVPIAVVLFLVILLLVMMFASVLFSCWGPPPRYRQPLKDLGEHREPPIEDGSRQPSLR